MQTSAEESFQVATLVVVVLIALVCMGFLLIFVNPQVALNPLKPPLPTATLLLLSALPPTWTPTPTDTPTLTPSPTPTDTPTLTPTSTNTPTNTPTLTPTRRPTPRPPAPPAPTASPWVYFVVPDARGSCQHSGGTFIEGYVTNPNGEEAGTLVNLGTAPGSGIVQTITTGSDRSPGYFTFVLNANGARPGTWYLWISDANGKVLSDPNTGRVTTNAIRNSDDPSACWQAFIDFARH